MLGTATLMQPPRGEQRHVRYQRWRGLFIVTLPIMPGCSNAQNYNGAVCEEPVDGALLPKRASSMH